MIVILKICNFIGNYGGVFNYGLYNYFIANYGLGATTHFISSTIENNILIGNKSFFFAGISNSIIDIRKSTISKNECVSIFYNAKLAKLKLEPNTVTENQYIYSIPAYVFSVVKTEDSVFIKNNIIANNFYWQNNHFAFELIPSSPSNNLLISDGNNYIGKINLSANVNMLNTDVIETISNPIDPKLLPLGNYGGRTRAHLPYATSPVIDNGALSISANTDQRAVARTGVNNLVPDRGSVELQKPMLINVSPTAKKFCKWTCVKLKYTLNDYSYLPTATGSFYSTNPNYTINQTSDTSACIGINTIGSALIYVVLSGTDTIYRDTINILVNTRCDASPDLCCRSIGSSRSLTKKKENEEINSIELFPNPANEYIQVIMENITPISVEIYNSVGQRVKTINPKELNEVYVGDLVNGVYFMKVTTDEETKLIKFIKN